jgi:uncharacterized membrane protein YhaH (DUF805 family)
MEGLFEFMFGAGGRINRAKYWRSFIIYCIAGLFAGFLLLAAAVIAAPVFIIMVFIVFIPWLLWGFSISTERLHDRNKSAWWLLVFYLLPAALGQIAKWLWFGGMAGIALHYVLALAGLVLTLWGFVEMGFLRGTHGSNSYGPDPLSRATRKR